MAIRRMPTDRSFPRSVDVVSTSAHSLDANGRKAPPPTNACVLKATAQNLERRTGLYWLMMVSGQILINFGLKARPAKA